MGLVAQHRCPNASSSTCSHCGIHACAEHAPQTYHNGTCDICEELIDNARHPVGPYGQRQFDDDYDSGGGFYSSGGGRSDGEAGSSSDSPAAESEPAEERPTDEEAIRAQYEQQAFEDEQAAAAEFEDDDYGYFDGDDEAFVDLS